MDSRETMPRCERTAGPSRCTGTRPGAARAHSTSKSAAKGGPPAGWVAAVDSHATSLSEAARTHPGQRRGATRLLCTHPPWHASLELARPAPLPAAEIRNAVAAWLALTSERPTDPECLVPLSRIAERPSRLPAGFMASVTSDGKHARASRLRCYDDAEADVTGALCSAGVPGPKQFACSPKPSGLVAAWRPPPAWSPYLRGLSRVPVISASAAFLAAAGRGRFREVQRRLSPPCETANSRVPTSCSAAMACGCDQRDHAGAVNRRGWWDVASYAGS